MSIKKFNDFLKNSTMSEKHMMKSDDKEETDNNKSTIYSYVIVTQEAIDKAMKSNKLTNIQKIGYIFRAESKEELEELKSKYKVGDKYNDETIASTTTLFGEFDFENYL